MCDYYTIENSFHNYTHLEQQLDGYNGVDGDADDEDSSDEAVTDLDIDDADLAGEGNNGDELDA